MWLTADDGVRLRAALWPSSGRRGTIFLLPGRCEYVEKYGRTAERLTSEGYTVLSIDWRGQGLSDRLLRNPDIGHVTKFLDYQRDVQALVAFAEERGLPEPWFLLAHSMGGAIGLRALSEADRFRAAAFSAPMWGIVITPKLQQLARALPILARRIGMGARQAPTTSKASFFLEAPFEGNQLTTDRDTWDYMKRHAAEEDRFRLGGPSLIWLGEALAETRALHYLPKPDVPTYVAVGDLEKIVDPSAIERTVSEWPSATLEHFADAEHELMMERPPVRDAFIDHALATFDSAQAPSFQGDKSA